MDAEEVVLVVWELFDSITRPLSDEAFLEACDMLADQLNTAAMAKREEMPQ